MRNFSFALEKAWIQKSKTSASEFLLFFISSFFPFGLYIWVWYLFYLIRNQTYERKDLLELIKRISKVHQDNMPRERALHFDQ